MTPQHISAGMSGGGRSRCASAFCDQVDSRMCVVDMARDGRHPWNPQTREKTHRFCSVSQRGRQ